MEGEEVEHRAVEALSAGRPEWVGTPQSVHTPLVADCTPPAASHSRVAAAHTHTHRSHNHTRIAEPLQKEPEVETVVV